MGYFEKRGFGFNTLESSVLHNVYLGLNPLLWLIYKAAVVHCSHTHTHTCSDKEFCFSVGIVNRL